MPAPSRAKARTAKPRRAKKPPAFRRLDPAKVYQLLEPGPVVLLATSEHGRPNVMTMSWHMLLDFEPAKLACIVSEGNFSFAALDATKECVIAIPASTLAPKVVAVGNCHGSDTDKFDTIGLTALPASKVQAPLIAECFVNLECRAIDALRDYDMFMLEVVEAWIDPAAKDAKTIHHCGYGNFVVDGRRIRLPSRMR